MSYTVSIKPVQEVDLNNLVKSSHNIEIEKHEHHTSIKYTKDNKDVYFDYSNNEITYCGTPSNFEMNILQELALRFNASVEGEDGTDLTGIESVNDNQEGCGATFYTILGLIIALLLYWQFIDN